MSYVLDTDTCVFALRHNAAVLERLTGLSPEDVAVTAVTEAELFYGVLLSRDPGRTRVAVDAFLLPIARLSFDTRSAEHHASIRRALRRQPIGERDLITASVARGLGATLVTHNVREFARVPELDLEDWYRT